MGVVSDVAIDRIGPQDEIVVVSHDFRHEIVVVEFRMMFGMPFYCRVVY